MAFVVTAFIIVPALWYNHVRNGLIDRETTMSAQYQANQAELDAFTKKINEEFQVAGAKADQLDRVITDAVKGRYGNGQDLIATTPGSPGSQLISALQEAYPNPDLSIYDKIVTEISAGREKFKQVQDKLLDMIRGYKTYRSRGVIHAAMVSAVGYPQLEARIGLTKDCPADNVQGNACVYTGKDALRQMQLIVTSGATNNDFTTGTEPGLSLTVPSTVPAG